MRGLAVLRWATWLWSVGAIATATDRLARPWLAVLLLAAALVITVLGTRIAVDPERPLTVGFVVAELAVGFCLLFGEGFVFEEGHAFAGRQGLAGGWPVVGVIEAGIALGPWPAALAGAVVGFGRLLGAVANGVRAFDGDQVASLASTVAFYALYGAVAGWVGGLLRRAEVEMAVSRARDEVTRTLHDGVLQTLALVERRVATDDPELALLARKTDRDLRIFLYERRPEAVGDGDLVPALRAAALRAAQPYDLDVSVSVVDDDLRLEPATTQAVIGAVSEAVTNVGKHAGARRAVVFAQREDDGSVFVTVRDDGCGFDPATVPADRQGIARSVVGRLAEVGGRVEVETGPGRGTEVRLWVK